MLLPTDSHFKRYGLKGIKVEWNSFNSFYNDMKDLYAQHISKYGSDRKNCQIDRIDNNGNYCKNNCRFVTAKENNQSNKKTFKSGSNLMLQDIIEKIVIAPNGELLSQLGHELYIVGQELVDVKNLLSEFKEKLKDIEADKILKLKGCKDDKKTIPEIEATIRIETQDTRKDILLLENRKESLYAKYEGAKLVFEASKTRLIIEKKEF